MPLYRSRAVAGYRSHPDDVTGNIELYQNISDREAYLAFVSLLEADSSFLLRYYFNLRCRLPLVSDRGLSAAV